MAKFQKNRKSRKAIPGYTLIPKGDHYEVRKIGITSERVKKDPAFGATRRYANEFGKAAKMSTVIRKAFLSQIDLKHTHSLLVKQLIDVLDTDVVNSFGDRCFGDAKYYSLVGFNFNPAQPFEQIVNQPFIVEHKASLNQIEVTVPRLVPDKCITAPEGFSFFSFTVYCMGINGKEMSATLSHAKSNLLLLGPHKTPRKKLIFNMEAEPVTAYLVLASIDFSNINPHKKRSHFKGKDLPLAVIDVIHPPR